MRDLDLNDLRVFVRVVDRGRLTLAARELGVPTSTVSRTLVRLERRTGTRLLQRTPRSMHATSEGRALYESVHQAVGALERASAALEPSSKQPKGTLRVTAAPEIGSAFLADVVVAFSQRYPLVEVELVLTNRATSLVDEGLDVAVRAAPQLSDSTLVARKVGELQHGLYAAPAYLEREGAPESPADLAKHRCIVFRAKDFAKTWTLEGDRGTAQIPVHGCIAADDFGYIRASVVAGGGIALLPRFICAKDEAAGRLARVLPRFTARGATLYVLYPSAAHVPARVTAFRDFIVAAFGRLTR